MSKSGLKPLLHLKIIDQVILYIVFADFRLGHSETAYGDSSAVDRFGVTRNQRMPVCERASLGEAAIRAALRQPLIGCRFSRRQNQAVRHLTTPVRIIGAATLVNIKQAASNIRVVDASVFFVLEFVQATASATVAQRLPFLFIHFGKRLALPEWFIGIAHKRRFPSALAHRGNPGVVCPQAQEDNP